MNIVERLVMLMISEDDSLYLSEISNAMDYEVWQIEEALKTLIIAVIVVKKSAKNFKDIYNIRD